MRSVEPARAAVYLPAVLLAPLSTAAVALALAYAGLQVYFLVGWWRTPRPRGRPQRRRWSVVIAARDEAQHLRSAEATALLPTLGRARLARGRDGGVGPVEVIVVDDHSADGTAELARHFPHVAVLSMPADRTGKKAALTHGIRHASGEWIVTLDADVRVGEDYLRHLDAATEGQVAVAGPVALHPAGGTWFERWQGLDFEGMMLITAASLRHGHFVMGNGANLAFAKTAYEAVGGYASPDGRESASGDDMVLLAKLAERFPGRVTFARDPRCVVETDAKPTVRAFVRQRWRWSAKTGLNHQGALTAVLGLTWVFHVGLLLGIPLAVVGCLGWAALGLAWGVKLVADFVLLRGAERFFASRGPRYLDWTYPLQSLAHALYVAGVGTLALLPFDYEWKGRRHRV